MKSAVTLIISAAHAESILSECETLQQQIFAAALKNQSRYVVRNDVTLWNIAEHVRMCVRHAVVSYDSMARYELALESERGFVPRPAPVRVDIDANAADWLMTRNSRAHSARRSVLLARVYDAVIAR